MQRNRNRSGLTILLVPHSERAPVSLRLPFWLVPLLTVVVVAAITAAAVFGYKYYSMQRQLTALLGDQATERVRQREMRATILSQQDEVRSLSTQVEGFKSELLSVRRLSDEIRDILGLPVPTPSPGPEPTLTPLSSVDSIGGSGAWGLSHADDAAVGGRLALQPSARSMRMAVERGHEIVGLRSAVPGEIQMLQELRQLVVERKSRLGAGGQGDWASLQSALRLWAAAPHQWPVWPHPISSEFGYREFRGVYGYHYGIDLAVWIGTKVHATRDGTVVASGWQTGYGLMVEIEHGSGYSTIYAHNSRLLVKTGDKVKAGDVIALSGSSGNSTGPHVHYEIHLYGTPVDPLRYIDEG